MLIFQGIKKSTTKDKLYTAIFYDNETKTVKKVNFGLKGGSQYPTHKNIEVRNNYIKRHMKDLDTNDPTRPGYLSIFILWNKKTLKASLADYKKRYNYYLKTGKFIKTIPNSPLS